MPLLVRRGSRELVLPDEDALAVLYRRRQVAPFDLVWHPARNRWVRVDAFLFMDGAASARAEPAPSPPPTPLR